MLANKTIFKSPLRYPGGKNCIYRFVADLLRSNGLVGYAYAEPYAGGAGVALRLLMDGVVSEIHINDLDKAIYSFWNTILTKSDKFCRWIEEVDVTIDNWNYYKSVYQNKEQHTEFEIAQSAFFLNRTNVSGVLKGGPIGGAKQLGKYKIDVRFNKPDLIARIKDIALYADKIHLYTMDGAEFIKEIDRMSRDTFIYLDPPYFKKGAELYLNAFKADDHKHLADVVSTLHTKWMVSYDNNEFIISLYERYPKIIYQLSQCTSNRVGDELIVFDSRLNYRNSIQLLKNTISI